uniref:Insulin-like growth factor binding protein 7 n=1 Tax=Paramormyrops kingsleyae TaxID=1676925 RepID=A0A3B3R169_9TELE
MLGLIALAASLTYVAAASAEIRRNCEPCDPSLCEALSAGGCEFGILLDSCGCCSACAAGEGEKCAGRGSALPRCAPGLECKKSNKGKRSKLGVCVCKSSYEVCGTDGVTYSTGCDLKAASLKAQSDKLPEIKVQHKGKCYQAPVIVTAPGEIWNVTGSQVYLSCEAIGVPTPVLTWKKGSRSIMFLQLLQGTKAGRGREGTGHQRNRRLDTVEDVLQKAGKKQNHHISHSRSPFISLCSCLVQQEDTILRGCLSMAGRWRCFQVTGRTWLSRPGGGPKSMRPPDGYWFLRSRWRTPARTSATLPTPKARPRLLALSMW